MNARLYKHRRELKHYLLHRDEKCPGCGDLLIPGVNVHMHEAFIRKSTMMGLSIDSKVELNCEENCTLLCMNCNLNEPTGLREIVWGRHCEIYGTAHMVEWYERMSDLFKSPLPKFW